MFMRPHDYQVILEGTFTDGGTAPQLAYVEDRATHPEAKPYTFEPEPFVLPDLLPSGPGHTARLSSFQGGIYRGHFERFDTEEAKQEARIGGNVVVKVTRVVHFQKFELDPPSLPQLTYFLFGRGQELFLAHLITKPPDFDQLIAVTIDGPAVPDEALRGGVPVAFPGRANKSGEKIEPGQKLSGMMELAGKSVPVEVNPGAELYFETGDLARDMRPR